MLALACLISAAVCINKITLVDVNLIIMDRRASQGFGMINIHFVSAHAEHQVTIIDYDLAMRTQAAAGWIIFLSIIVLLYQTFAVVQLFLYIPPLYMKIPIRKTFWYLFPLIVSLDFQ